MKTSGQKCWWVQPVASECIMSAGVNEHHVLCGYRFLHHPSFILFSPCAKQFSPGDARLAKGCCGNSHKFLIVQISESHASSSVSPQRLHLIQSHTSAKPLHPSSTNPDIYEQESGQELHPAILEDLKMYSSYSKWKKRVECVCVCVCVCVRKREKEKKGESDKMKEEILALLWMWFKSNRCLSSRTFSKHNYAFLFHLDAGMKDAWLTSLWWWMLNWF